MDRGPPCELNERRPGRAGAGAKDAAGSPERGGPPAGRSVELASAVCVSVCCTRNDGHVLAVTRARAPPDARSCV